jgi:acid-sensing ion channel, other
MASVRQRKLEISKQLKTIQKVCAEYSNYSSIHGFHYLIEHNRSRVEKVWWIVWIFISFIGCRLLISDLHRKWNEIPVIVSISEKATPLWQIPFPAVTICPEAKTDSDLFDIKENISPYHTLDRVLHANKFDELEDGRL